MNSQVQTFEDFPLTFLHHEKIPYISHKSLADYFKWHKTTRKNRFKKNAETHPEMVAYFKTTHGEVARKLDHPFVCTDEFRHLTLCNQITRCLTKQGLILAMVKEDRHPRAVEFQKFACAVLDSYMTHGEVGPHEATSVADLAAKINAENEAKKLDHEREKLALEHKKEDNEKLRLTMGVKRLEIQEKKVENAALIQKNEELETRNYQLKNLQAIPQIYKRKQVRQPTKSQFEATKKFVKQLGRRYIEWIGSKPYFRSRALFLEALPRIDRFRYHIPRYEMTDEWKLANGKYSFK